MFPPFLCGLLQCSCYCAIASLSCVSGTLFDHQPCKEFIISWTAGNIRHSLMSGLIRLNLYREISYYLLEKKTLTERHGEAWKYCRAVHSQTKKQEESTLHYIFKGSAVKRQQQKSLRNPFLPGKNEQPATLPN